MQDQVSLHPCQQCGACCNSFRVSFYWAESDAYGIPGSLTEKVNDFYLCMAGTQSRSPACMAHRGVVGHSSACSIYPHRPSPCREVQPGDAQCTSARARHGMHPLHASKELNHL